MVTDKNEIIVFNI